MKPSGSSSRRQRSPTSRRSTCETGGPGVSVVGDLGKALLHFVPPALGKGGGIRGEKGR